MHFSFDGFSAFSFYGPGGSVLACVLAGLFVLAVLFVAALLCRLGRGLLLRRLLTAGGTMSVSVAVGLQTARAEFLQETRSLGVGTLESAVRLVSAGHPGIDPRCERRRRVHPGHGRNRSFPEKPL